MPRYRFDLEAYVPVVRTVVVEASDMEAAKIKCEHYYMLDRSEKEKWEIDWCQADRELTGFYISRSEEE